MVLKRLLRCVLGPRLKSMECMVWTMSVTAVVCLCYSLGKLQTQYLMENSAVMVKAKDTDTSGGAEGKSLSLAKMHENMGLNEQGRGHVEGEIEKDGGGDIRHALPKGNEADRLMYHRSRREGGYSNNRRLIKNAQVYVPPADEGGDVPHDLDELDGYNYFMISEEEAGDRKEKEEQRPRQRNEPYRPPRRNVELNRKNPNGWLEKPANVEYHKELLHDRRNGGMSARDSDGALLLDKAATGDSRERDNGLKFLYIDDHGNKVYGAARDQKAAFQPLKINVNRGQGGAGGGTQQGQPKPHSKRSSELSKNSNDAIKQFVEQNIKNRKSGSEEKKAPPAPQYRALNLYVTTNGRFGNHLFQYASLYGLSRATNRLPVFPSGTEIPEVFIKSRFSIEEGLAPHDIATVHETNSGIFTPTLYTLPNQDSLVCCYLQSWKYFNNYKTMIKHLFRFKREIRLKAGEILLNVKNTFIRKNPDFFQGQYTPELTYIGVHVRRGDYMLKEHLTRGYRPAPLSYIYKAMQYYRSRYSNCVFVVSSDDLSWCTKHLNGSDVTFVSGPDHGVDLATLTTCNHTIMTVGTFGWWAGWLAGGEVVYYKDWIMPGSEIESSYIQHDYFLPDWKAIGDMR